MQKLITHLSSLSFVVVHENGTGGFFSGCPLIWIERSKGGNPCSLNVPPLSSRSRHAPEDREGRERDREARGAVSEGRTLVYHADTRLSLGARDTEGLSAYERERKREIRHTPLVAVKYNPSSAQWAEQNSFLSAALPRRPAQALPPANPARARLRARTPTNYSRKTNKKSRCERAATPYTVQPQLR
jgi:hypothetical protein